MQHPAQSAGIITPVGPNLRNTGMTLTNEPAIERLVHRLLDRSLPKAEWTHEAHFAAALWLLRHKSPHVTSTGMRAVISAYNEASGNPNTDSSGYHHTITVASMRAAANALAGKDHLQVSLVLA